MNDPLTNNEDEIAQRAIQWCMRLHESDCTELERRQFKKWHDGNTNHARHYNEALSVWGLTGQVAPVYHPPITKKHDAPDRRPANWLQQFFDRYLSINMQRFAMLMVALPSVIAMGWMFNWVPIHHARYITTESTQQVILADGSEVQLNLNTELSFSNYRQQRSVNFKYGEAYFHVSHDQQHPFQVKAGPIVITVTGTQFNVWKYNDNVVVTVIDGSVNVNSEDTKYQLTGKMQASYDAEKTHVEINTSADTSKILAWREGKLILDDLLLTDAISRINPYLEKQLIIMDASAAKLRIGGIYNIANIRDLPQLLPKILPVRIEQRSDGSLLIFER